MCILSRLLLRGRLDNAGHHAYLEYVVMTVEGLLYFSTDNTIGNANLPVRAKPVGKYEILSY